MHCWHYRCWLALTALAAEIWLQPGDSKVVQFQENVDTVFVSAQAVVDYEIIGDKSMVIYAKSKGRSEIAAFNKAGEQVLKSIIIVDPVLGHVNKQISEQFPDSNVAIQKVGETYIISGTVAKEEDKDQIYQIVGVGVGAKAKEYTRKVKSKGKDSDSDDEKLPWLSQTYYEGVINKLQLPITNQVNVKLSVVEVTREFTENIGVDWSNISSGGDIAPGLFRLVKFNAGSITNLIHAIGNESVAHILAEPNLSVLSGETAEFLVGGEVPIVTSNINGSTISYKEYGIKLNIGAKVNSNKKIRIILGQEVSNLDKSVEGNSSFPTIQVRRAKTTVDLADGESFLLGGLINKNEQELLSRIPFIGDIPILGALFRNSATKKKNTELVVIATVHLVKPITQRDVVYPEYRATSTWARLFNIDGITGSRDKERAVNFIEQGGFIK